MKKKITLSIIIGLLINSCATKIYEQKNDINKNVDELKAKQYEYLNNQSYKNRNLKNDYERYNPNQKPYDKQK